MTIGVFPAFASTNFGGLEESALLAAQVLDNMNRQRRETVSPAFLCYGAGAEAVDDKRTVLAPSRSQAIWKTLRHKWTGETLLVWHIDLLKLLPCFRLPDAKVVLFLHGIEAWRRQSYYLRRLLNRVDVVLSNSQHTWDRFIAINPHLAPRRHEVVHLGVGEPVAGRRSLPSNTPAALMIGRMDRREDYKGHREMIAAWPAVVRRIPDAELWITSTGNLEAELQQVARASSVHDRIRFFGRVSVEKKQDLLCQCRCLALPSRGEGFGLVYLEAMRIGRPCLVSTVDAGREVVNPPEAGLAVDPSNFDELAGAVCRLLTAGPEWEGFSERAQQRYNGQFTAAGFQQRLFQALTSDAI
jgi:phosphatidylinositol alpha-1,6-mannosyltransferase